MIVVDTSVWIAAFRSKESREARVLSGLLDADEVCLAAPVRVEILSGASRTDGPRLQKLLSALPIIYPTDETWQVIGRWVDRAAQTGQRFGVGDLMIGAAASEIGGLVWSLDGAFARMRELGLVQIYEA